jgi:hypothetical protein
MDTQLCIEEVRAAMLEGEELDTVALVLRSSEPEVNKDATVVAMLCLVWSGCLTGMLFIVGDPNYSIWQQMHCIQGITPFDSLKWIFGVSLRINGTITTGNALFIALTLKSILVQCSTAPVYTVAWFRVHP